MIKKIIAEILVLINLFSNVSANELNCGSMESLFQTIGMDLPQVDLNSTISRFDGVALIMTSIGVLPNCGEEGYALGRETSDDISTEKLVFTSINYAVFAVRHTNIIFGEYIDEESMLPYFNYERPITTNEAIAIMSRCVDDLGESDLNTTYKVAEKLGLINDKDSFSIDINKPILYKDFLTILKRFLNMKQYLYFEITSGGYSELWTEGRFRKNKNRDITYYEYLKKVIDTKQYDREMK